MGEVEDDRSRRFPPQPLSPRPLSPRCDRLLVLEEDDLDLRRLVVVSVDDPRPPLPLDCDRDLICVTDGDLEDLDTEVAPRTLVWDWECDREVDRERYRDLDRLCCVSCRLVLLDGRRPYPFLLGSACCDCLSLDLVVESEEVAGVLVVASGSVCPGDPGGVELVTGANTVSLLTLTSHCPVLLYIRAPSANST